MTDEEIGLHTAAILLLCDREFIPDIWDYRIAVRDYFFNELWLETKFLRKVV